MAAWRREPEALLAELLGGAGVAWIGWGSSPHADAIGATAVSLIGLDPEPEDRRQVFAALADALAPSGVLVVVDHNRPRRTSAVFGALAGAPWVPGWTLAGRWRRLARPTAREVQAAGFRVEKLRLVASERVQVVVAIRP